MPNRPAMDLTYGAPGRQILLFSLPLILGSLFQQLYSFADTVMVGRFLGDAALAAVGATGSLSFLTLGLVEGCAVGFAIPLAQAMGAKDRPEFQRYFWNGLWLCAALAAGMTIGVLLLTEPLLKLIRTPEDIFGQALAYIRVVFLGIPGSILYNYTAAVLRASGDSRRPALFLLCSSFGNIVLDYLCLAVIPMGVAGAALATFLCQTASGIVCAAWLWRRTDLLRGSAGRRAFSGRHAAALCRIGFPMAFDHSFSNFGIVVLQGAINGLGTAAIAAQTTGEKIRRMFTLPMESVGMGVATYAGQNTGAKRFDRVRDGVKAGLKLHLVYCALSWAVLFFGKGPLVRFVLGPDAGESAVLAVQYLGTVSCLFCFHGSLMVVRNTLQGMGHSLCAVLSGAAELAGRIVGSWLSVRWLGFSGICLTNPLAWTCGLGYCVWMLGKYLGKALKAQ